METWLGASANDLVAEYTTNVANKLSTGVTDLTNKMTAYKAAALTLSKALAAATLAVNNGVTGDGGDSGKTKTASNKVGTDTTAWAAAKDKVTAFIGAEGLWGKAKAAVKTARDAVAS